MPLFLYPVRRNTTFIPYQGNVLSNPERPLGIVGKLIRVSQSVRIYTVTDQAASRRHREF